MSAPGNVEIAAIYSGMPADVQLIRATALLARLDSAALMNGADVILAGEPTGALDRQSGDEVLKILEELYAQGHIVILVTHDM